MPELLTWEPIEHGAMRAESPHVPPDADRAFYEMHPLTRGWWVERHKIRSSDGRRILCAYLGQATCYPDEQAARDAAHADMLRCAGHSVPQA